jgi:hypothetical protein
VAQGPEVTATRLALTPSRRGGVQAGRGRLT